MIVILGVLSMAFVVGFTARTYYSSAAHLGGQSRRSSIIEAWCNILIGFGVNFAANFLIFPLVDAHITLWQNWWMGWCFTTISIVRQYAIRRWFNDHIHRIAQGLSRG